MNRKSNQEAKQEIFNRFVEEYVNKTENLYKRVVYQDLVKRYHEWFWRIHGEIVAGAPMIYPSDPILEINRNMVRVSLMIDIPAFAFLRERIRGEEKSIVFPYPTSIGCDYLLDLEGKIIYAPEVEDIKKRISVVKNTTSDNLTNYE